LIYTNSSREKREKKREKRGKGGRWKDISSFTRGPLTERGREQRRGQVATGPSFLAGREHCGFLRSRRSKGGRKKKKKREEERGGGQKKKIASNEARFPAKGEGTKKKEKSPSARPLLLGPHCFLFSLLWWCPRERRGKKKKKKEKRGGERETASW